MDQPSIDRLIFVLEIIARGETTDPASAAKAALDSVNSGSVER
jgi:hypothetical protein